MGLLLSIIIIHFIIIHFATITSRRSNACLHSGEALNLFRSRRFRQGPRGKKLCTSITAFLPREMPKASGADFTGASIIFHSSIPVFQNTSIMSYVFIPASQHYSSIPAYQYTSIIVYPSIKLFSQHEGCCKIFGFSGMVQSLPRHKKYRKSEIFNANANLRARSLPMVRFPVSISLI